MMVSTLADLTITLDGLYVSKGSVDVERFKRWRFTRQWWLGFTRSNASNMQGPGRLIRIDRGSPSVWKSNGALIAQTWDTRMCVTSGRSLTLVLAELTELHLISELISGVIALAHHISN